MRGAWGRVSEIEKKRQIEIALVEKPSSMGIGHTSAVRQVLINLISNAVKFSRDGGKIWVGLAEEMHWIHFSVKDEGYRPTKSQESLIDSTAPPGASASKARGLGFILQSCSLRPWPENSQCRARSKKEAPSRSRYKGRAPTAKYRVPPLSPGKSAGRRDSLDEENTTGLAPSAARFGVT